MNRRTSLVGAVAFMCLSAPQVAAQPRITFTRDVAPILFKHCVACHRPGQSAPFSLLSYEDARPRARRIAEVTRNREMPPWKPEPDHGRFQRDRRMPDAEIAAIQNWVAQGMVRGDAADMPSMPIWPDEWTLGTPDVVIQMP